MSTHKYLDETGLGQVWNKIKALIENMPEPEDDTEILNLLTEYDYPAPIIGTDGDVITDDDSYIILG